MRRPSLLRKYRPPFPERGPHQYRLLMDGETFLPAMLEAIDGARLYLMLELYLVEDGQCAGRFVNALSGAAARGVDVYILLDGYAGRGLSSAHRRQLADAGARLAFHNPLELRRWRLALWRDHRKLLLVDGETAYVGGMGITDDFDPQVRGDAAWHDCMLAVEGPCVADWQQLFASEWRRWAGHCEPLPPTPAPGDSGMTDGQVAGALRHGGRTVMSSVLAAIVRSRRRVWIATGYFVPTRRLRRALVRAARQGVDVSLLLPGPATDHPAVWHAGRRFYGRLLRAGVRIHEYAPRFMHAKMVLCDDWASVGSSNLDHWTLRWNMEANQNVMRADFAAELARVFEADFAQSTLWTREQWSARGRWQRFKEWLFGTLDDWLVQISYRYRLRMKDE
ncbi:phospholipase D-like domain-containing protein [Thioalkalivibrio thiocyanodenitrificans]|uniref:phospholipase D-like domain-containing protein n=1 Tax=Thioalkalivibrio thiocyanodenitrificans TaxID=243063 RepID=UPI0003A1D4B9|nr:phospholipase D-like domain-containing protein [Thioalkalivibrio thiocyanodenitrificans]